MEKIFSDGSTLDELIGLGILAGMLTEEPKPETIAKFRKNLKALSGVCGCDIGIYGKEALKDGEMEAETARFAAREIAKNCIISFLLTSS